MLTLGISESSVSRPREGRCIPAGQESTAASETEKLHHSTWWNPAPFVDAPAQGMKALSEKFQPPIAYSTIFNPGRMLCTAYCRISYHSCGGIAEMSLLILGLWLSSAARKRQCAALIHIYSWMITYSSIGKEYCSWREAQSLRLTGLRLRSKSLPSLIALEEGLSSSKPAQN